MNLLRKKAETIALAVFVWSCFAFIVTLCGYAADDVAFGIVIGIIGMLIAGFAKDCFDK